MGDISDYILDSIEEEPQIKRKIKMTRCECGSYAINHNAHGRDGSDGHLCDVCYWRKRAEKENTWQPIKTAPRDGTAILVCQATEAGKPITKNFGLFVQRAVWWGKENDGKWVIYCSLPIDPICFFNPTHWMLVPESPWRPVPDPPDVG